MVIIDDPLNDDMARKRAREAAFEAACRRVNKNRIESLTRNGLLMALTGHKYAPHQGKNEIARRQKRMQRKMLRVEYVGPDPRFIGETALGRLIATNVLEVQVDRRTHPASHGWRPCNASHWALRV